MPCRRDTIFALSSGSAPSGVAVVRVSGDKVADILRATIQTVPDARRATLAQIRDRNDAPIDRGLVLHFPGPHSFTGEDCAEYHIHGGRAVVARMLTTLAGLGLRMAEAGEFTRRAFENGKLDLVEVEALGDLVAADTEAQRRLAVEQADGRLSALYRRWADDLLRGRALIEAELDFPEEEDIPGAVSDRVWQQMAALVAEMRQHLRGHTAGEIVRDGYKVVIAGRPNSGKSSLINYLANRPVAIVTDHPGTTRDVLSVDLDLGGYLVRVSDTAGLRDTADIVEREGVTRARKAVEDANLVLHLRDVADPVDWDDIGTCDRELRIWTKCDLVQVVDCADSWLQISTFNGVGIDSLTKQIVDRLVSAIDNAESSQIARHRQAELLQKAIDGLNDALEDKSLPLEVRSEYLRQANQHLGRITGQVDVEDLLDVIFSEFCVGK